MIIIGVDWSFCPANRLAPSELARRQSGAYPLDESTALNNDHSSATDEPCLSQEDAQEMAQRLQVDSSIVTFNAFRLRDICTAFLLDYERYQRDVLGKVNVPSEELQLPSKEMTQVLEFFLQIDGKFMLQRDTTSVLVCLFICFS